MCSFGSIASDPVNLTIARRAHTVLGKVIRARLALQECAYAAESFGDISGFDTETWAVVLGMQEKTVVAIVEACKAKGLIVDGRLVGVTEVTAGNAEVTAAVTRPLT